MIDFELSIVVLKSTAFNADSFIPLPVKKDSSVFAFSVMIVLNFIIFVLIGCGQMIIYLSLRDTSRQVSQHEPGSSGPRNKAKDLKVARRLFTVVMSDFLCWFPIGVTGLMAAYGIAISDRVSVSLAIFVLPFNSAINPFLYTINILMEKRKAARDKRLQTRILAQLKNEHLYK